MDLEGLFTLGTVVLDYRGYRVTAQSIIPGDSLVLKPGFYSTSTWKSVAVC